MGESSSPSDSDFGRISGNTTSKQRKSNATQTEQSNKARNARLDKERTQAFTDYEKYNPDDTMSTNKEVNRNIELARDLEYKANNTNFMGKERGKNVTIFGKDLGFNLMDTSIVGKGLDAIQRSNYLGQAEKLRGGGKAVYGDKGSYQGVVSKNFFGANVYSGNADYSPIGRSQGASYDSRTGTYTSSAIQNSGNDGNDSQVSNNTPSSTQISSIDKTDSTTSLSTTAKRSLLANNQGGASTRYFIKT